VKEPIPAALKMPESHLNPWAFCVAPMLDWTDRHCRFFHRKLSKKARLYTEMVTTGALRHGDVARHLDFDPSEHPLALQVGGSDPTELAHAARLAQQWGYDEINLNCGCPSDRVQRGAFGACLMKQPMTVAIALRAMREACDLAVTVKHRIGVDDQDSYDFVRDFVGTVHQHSGVEVFIVHARKALLKGLSPKENRSIPPLNYGVIDQLQLDFPDLHFVLNGGLTDWTLIESIWQKHKQKDKQKHDQESEQESSSSFLPSRFPVLGVMVGREAYQNPWMLHEVDQRLSRQSASRSPFLDIAQNILNPTHNIHAPSRLEIIESFGAYLDQLKSQQLNPHVFTRHILGLFNGLPRAKKWRQTLSQRDWVSVLNHQSLVALARELL